MKIVLVALSLFIAFEASARKPAVEDFVGIEAEVDPTPTPQGTEALFNFSNEVSDVKPNQIVLRNPAHINTPIPQPISENSSTNFPFAEVIGLLTLLGLPLVSFKILRQKSDEKMAEIKSLSDYRKDKKDDDIKKAS